MDLIKLQEFFLWGFIINIVIYIIQMLLTLSFRNFLSKSHGKLFGLSKEVINTTIYSYFAIYKIVINAFFVAPWIAIEIIK